MPHIDLIAFDPSINHIGVAYLVDGRIELARTIHAMSEGDDRYSEISWKIEAELAGLSSMPIVIENPDSWTRRNVKELLKLAIVVGVIHATTTHLGHEVYLIPTSDWKGRKTKQWTTAELEVQGYNTRALGWDEHARDAAALALAAEGIVRVGRIA